MLISVYVQKLTRTESASFDPLCNSEHQDRKPATPIIDAGLDRFQHAKSARNKAELDWIVSPLRHRQQMIQHTSTATGEGGRRQRPCTAGSMDHPHEGNCWSLCPSTHDLPR